MWVLQPAPTFLGTGHPHPTPDRRIPSVEPVGFIMNCREIRDLGVVLDLTQLTEETCPFPGHSSHISHRFRVALRTPALPYALRSDFLFKSLLFALKPPKLLLEAVSFTSTMNRRVGMKVLLEGDFLGRFAAGFELLVSRRVGTRKWTRDHARINSVPGFDRESINEYEEEERAHFFS